MVEHRLGREFGFRQGLCGGNSLVKLVELACERPEREILDPVTTIIDHCLPTRWRVEQLRDSRGHRGGILRGEIGGLVFGQFAKHVEVVDQDDEPFGFERLDRSWNPPAATAEQIIDRVLGEVDRFTNGVPLVDDRTLVVIGHV